MSPEEGAIMGHEAFIRALMKAEQVYESQMNAAKESGLDGVYDVMRKQYEKVHNDRITSEQALQQKLTPKQTVLA